MLRKNVSILLYFSFCAVSLVWSDFPFIAFKRWIKALGDVEMVLVILTEFGPLGALKRLLTRLGFLLFPLSILFIRYYPDIGRRLTKSWTARTHRGNHAEERTRLGLHDVRRFFPVDVHVRLSRAAGSRPAAPPAGLRNDHRDEYLAAQPVQLHDLHNWALPQPRV